MGPVSQLLVPATAWDAAKEPASGGTWTLTGSTVTLVTGSAPVRTYTFATSGNRVLVSTGVQGKQVQLLILSR